jgi:hypothetical protein
MDFIFQLFIELVQPVGNFFAKKMLPKGMIEENSILSIFIGGLLVIATLIVLGFLLIIFTG